MVIRIARPGEPVRFIDKGPSYGRIYGQNYGGSIAIGGPAAPNPAPTPPSQIARAAVNRARRKAEAAGLCGRTIPSGTCARARGHGYSCRTRDWLDRRAAAYRANYTPMSRGAYARRDVVEP